MIHEIAIDPQKKPLKIEIEFSMSSGMIVLTCVIVFSFVFCFILKFGKERFFKRTRLL